MKIENVAQQVHSLLDDNGYAGFVVFKDNDQTVIFSTGEMNAVDGLCLLAKLIHNAAKSADCSYNNFIKVLFEGLTEFDWEKHHEEN